MTRKFRTKADYDSLTISIRRIHFIDATSEEVTMPPIVYSLSKLSTKTITQLALAGLRQALLEAAAGKANPCDGERAMLARYDELCKVGYPSKSI